MEQSEVAVGPTRRIHFPAALGRTGSTLLVMLVAAGVAWLMNAAIGAAPASVAVRPWLEIWMQFGVLIWVALLLLLFALPIKQTLKFDVAVALLALFLFGIAALALKNTLFSVKGLGVDQLEHTAIVVKISALGGFPDLMYKGLPAFYPSLYYAALSALGKLNGAEPYTLIKTGLLLVSFLLPFALYGSWRLLVGRGAAMGAAFTLLMIHDWLKPAEWLTIMLFVPWWLYWVLNLRGVRVGLTWRYVSWVALGSVLGALIFQTYYYWFFIGGVSLLVLLADHLRLAWLGGVAESPHVARSRVRVDWRNVLFMLAGTALLSAAFWLPYLVSMVSEGAFDVMQNRFLTEGKIELPMEFLARTQDGLVLLAGLVLLVIGASRRALPKAMLYMAIAVYVWIGIGYIAILVDKPLLMHRAFGMVDYVLFAGLGIGLMTLWQGWRAPWKTGPSAHLPRSLIALALVAITLFFARQTTYQLIDSADLVDANEAVVPYGDIEALDRLVGDAPETKVALMDRIYAQLLAFRPLFVFLPWGAYYSHPAGDFRARVDFLERLGALHSPEIARSALLHNRYDQVDILMLDEREEVPTLAFSDDNFPDRSKIERIYFANDYLDSPSFERRTEGQIAAWVPAAGATLVDRLADMETSANTSLTEKVELYVWLKLFGQDLELDIAAADFAARLDSLETAVGQAELQGLPRELLLDLIAAGEGDLQARAVDALQAGLAIDADLALFEQEQGEVARILGYDLAPDAETGRTRLTTYYQVTAPITNDYDVWFHATNKESGDIEYLDHKFAVPMSAWHVGAVVTDSTLLPADEAAYDYSFGIWNSETQKGLAQEGGDGAVTVLLPALGQED